MKPLAFVVSCEHAYNDVPESYRYLFSHQPEVLNTHRAWDPGSLEMGEKSAKELNASMFKTEVSRLLVECNRSIGHNQLFSEFSKSLPAEEKKHLMDSYYHPYRNSVEAHIRKISALHSAIHLSMHSFTPVWDGHERKTDIGLLFDADRQPEADFCTRWRDEIRAALPDYEIALNDPYNGADDGFTTYLRKVFDASSYLGIEIEINQKWVGTDSFEIIGDQILGCLLSVSESYRDNHS